MKVQHRSDPIVTAYGGNEVDDGPPGFDEQLVSPSVVGGQQDRRIAEIEDEQDVPCCQLSRSRPRHGCQIILVIFGRNNLSGHSPSVELRQKGTQ